MNNWWVREQNKIIAMTEFLSQQEIRPDLHKTLTWIFSEKLTFFVEYLAFRSKF